VLTLRRLTGLLLAFALTQLTLGAVPYCASGDMAALAGPPQGSPVPGSASHSTSKPCDACDPAPVPKAPCDHGEQGACATMTSCATLAVEGRVALPSLDSPVFRPDSDLLLAPLAVSLPLDTPPPRA